MARTPSKTNAVSLPQVVGKGYGSFWRSKARYRVVKGSRRSKKSKTMALDTITKMMEYPDANMLVVRKTLSSMKDSCYTELKWAIQRLGVSAHWHCTESPLQMMYKPTGQKIYFRGLDDPLKITSITVEVGALCWLWVEEAYEIEKESDFDTIDESILGDIPEGLYRQATITLNPWHEKCWIKGRFFDISDEEAEKQSVFRATTTYLCNEWLDKTVHEYFERMRTRNPRRYQVAALGNWGVTDGLVYENWHEQKFTLDDVSGLIPITGLDFGYNNPAAHFVGYLDKANQRLYVWDEIYKSGLLVKPLYNEIATKGYQKNDTVADCAEPRTIDELRAYGMRRIRGSNKGGAKAKDVRKNAIAWLQSLEIIIHPRCENFINEISCYTWAVDRQGNKTDDPVAKDDHLMDAMRYAVEEHVPSGKGWVY